MKQITIFFLVIISAILIIGCGNSPNTATNSNTANTNTTNSNNPLETKTPTPEQTVNAAPTLSPIYKAYCAAVVKKDDAAIRKFYTADTLAHFEQQMKDDGIKNVWKLLELDKISNEVCEVRNEQIKGDTAIAEIRTKGYPNGIPVLWVKEGGEWKLSNKRPPGTLQ